MKQKKVRTDKYQLAVRYQKRDGSWSEWESKGVGVWIGLEHVQSQIKLLKKAYLHKNIEILFKHGEKYLNYNGLEINGPIHYEANG